MLEPFEIDVDFPGGNITVDAIGDDVVSVHQDLRDTLGDWFYWAFRIRGGAGRRLTFQFSGSPAIALRGPAMSTDGGETWRWLGAASVCGNGFHIAMPEGVSEIRLCFGMPYGKRELGRFLDRHAGAPRRGDGAGPGRRPSSRESQNATS